MEQRSGSGSDLYYDFYGPCSSYSPLTHRLLFTGAFTGRHEIKPQSVVMSIMWNIFFTVSLLPIELGSHLGMSPEAISTELGG